MFKKITMLFCVMAILLLFSCKQETTPNTDGNNTTSQTQSTTSGIELEEDVFDDSDVSVTPSTNNSSTDNTSSDNVISSNTSSDNSSSDQTQTPDQSTSSDDEIVVGDDGTITLPIDRFN